MYYQGLNLKGLERASKGLNEGIIMIELRWKIEEWEEYRDGLPFSVKHKEKPVLQFRVEEGPRGERWWGEWTDVPEVYIGT